MLVRENRTYECALSGGCLEPAVADAAQRVLVTGEPVIIDYNLAEDSVFGLGIGCTGEVDIRIQRVDRDAVTEAWLNELHRGTPAVLVTILTGGSGQLLVSPGAVVGSLGREDLDLEAVRLARARLAGEPTSGVEWIDGLEVFFEAALPAPELILFGAGHDAPPVASLAWTLGFAVTVVDVREAFLTEQRFPNATLVLADFDRLADAIHPSAHSYVLVMDHHLERDRQSLRRAFESDAPYIGLLGPLSRRRRLLADLAAEGYSPSAGALARLHGPVGLSVGAETPEEVAVSILAEILAVRRGFAGGFLSGTSASLHRADAATTRT
jgi:xanthine/CO dehydrogenase XdhC/CoxF family maturation factor